MVSQVSNTIRKLQSPGRYAGLRRGVTIIEVLFATGIAITGLLGVASLLLMAGRQASQANRSLETQTLADDWYNEFTTRGMNRPENWIWYQDFTVGGVNAGTKVFSKRQFAAAPALRLTYSTGSNGPSYRRPLGKVSVCLDPVFFSLKALPSDLPTPSNPTPPIPTVVTKLGQFDKDFLPEPIWYRPAVFPYYQDGFNPITDSSLYVSTTSGLAWQDQPRMLRASLRVPTQGIPGLAQIVSQKQVESMFASTNELTTFVSQEDKTIPATRRFQLMPSPTAPNDTSQRLAAKGVHSAQYSWMATISPLDAQDSAPENYYTLSLVVMYQRDQIFVNPTPGSFPVATVGSPDPDSKPQGERLTWVVPLSGNFHGGSGGRVRLIASTGTDDEVGVGDWIMLSRHVAGTRANSSAPVEAYSVFRWYRILAADEKAIVGQVSNLANVAPFNGADPYGNASTAEVWARDVVLDGPDWNFTPVMDGVGLPAPTTGTLIKGAIAVHERVIEVPNPRDF